MAADDKGSTGRDAGGRITSTVCRSAGLSPQKELLPFDKA